MKDGKKRILVTGASGFIGQNLLSRWSRGDVLVPVNFTHSNVDDIAVLPGDVIIHLSGIAHQKKSVDPSIYTKVNFEKAYAFAEKAKLDGASQFIYISSTKVYGDATGIVPEARAPLPSDPYGKSKLQAEHAIMNLNSEGFAVSILRPPLVYGAGVKGNMEKLLELCASGRLLPFKGINNERTVVFVGNLVAMLEQIVAKRATGVFVPADDHPLSTCQMLRLIKQRLGTKNMEIAVPKIFVRLLAAVKPSLAAKIFGSLVYDNRQTMSRLHFTNPYSTEQGFDEMVEAFRLKSIKK